MMPPSSPLYYHNHARLFAAHPRVEDVNVTADFSYDRIMESYNLARRDGLQPEKLCLGAEEVGDLMTDTNFMRATGAPANSNPGNIGQIAGVDVEEKPKENVAMLIAQEDGELAYYIV